MAPPIVELTVAHDLNIVSELRNLTHKAQGFTDAAFQVRVLDDDFEITLNRSSVRENDDAVPVLVTLTAGSPPTTTANDTADVAVSFGEFGAAEAADFTAITAVTMRFPTGATMDTMTVMVDAVDDGAQDETNEHIRVTGPNSDPAVGAAYVKPATIMIIDDDPDSTDDADDARGLASVPLSIDGGATVGTAQVTVTIVDDADDDDGETIRFSAANVTIGDKIYTFGSTKLATTDNDDS